MSEYVDSVPNYDDGRNDQDTGMGALTHIMGLMFGFVGPLIIYAVTDDEFVKKNASRAFSWQIFLLLYMVLSLFMISFIIGILFLPLLFLLNLVFCIVGAVKAGNGEIWDYPGTVDLLERNEQNQTQNEYKQPEPEPERQQNKEQLTEEKLKQMYIDGEISDEEFDRKLDKLQRDEQMEMDYN